MSSLIIIIIIIIITIDSRPSLVTIVTTSLVTIVTTPHLELVHAILDD